MDVPAALSDLIAQRDPTWFREQYEHAVGRLEDHTADQDNPYYYSPGLEMSSYFGPVVLDDVGGEMTPEQARERAFEMLALADLAPHTPEPTRD